MYAKGNQIPVARGSLPTGSARRRARPLRSTCRRRRRLGPTASAAAGRRAAAAAASTAKRAEVASGRAASAARLVYLNAGINLTREAHQILLHDLLGRTQRTRDHDVLEARIPALHVLQIADEFLGGAAEHVRFCTPFLDRGGRR